MTDELSQLIQQMDVPPTGGRSSNNRTMQQTNGKYILPQSRQESSAACPLFCPLLGRTSLSASTVHIYCWKSFTYRKPPRFCAQHSFSATSVNIKPGLLGTPFGGTGVSAVLLAGETVRFSAVSTPPSDGDLQKGGPSVGPKQRRVRTTTEPQVGTYDIGLWAYPGAGMVRNLRPHVIRSGSVLRRLID